ITAGQLQAEIDRMTRGTRQPLVLAELFDALENDPNLIAESLARPLLAHRLITGFYARDGRFHQETKRRAEQALRAHRTIQEVGRASDRYGEVRWRRRSAIEAASPDSPEAGPHPPANPAPQSMREIPLDQNEWADRFERSPATIGRVGALQEDDET